MKRWVSGFIAGAFALSLGAYSLFAWSPAEPSCCGGECPVEQGPSASCCLPASSDEGVVLTAPASPALPTILYAISAVNSEFHAPAALPGKVLPSYLKAPSGLSPPAAN